MAGLLRFWKGRNPTTALVKKGTLIRLVLHVAFQRYLTSVKLLTPVNLTKLNLTKLSSMSHFYHQSCLKERSASQGDIKHQTMESGSVRGSIASD